MVFQGWYGRPLLHRARLQPHLTALGWTGTIQNWNISSQNQCRPFSGAYALVSESEQVPAARLNIWRKAWNQKSGGSQSSRLMLLVFEMKWGWVRHRYNVCPHTFGCIVYLTSSHWFKKLTHWFAYSSQWSRRQLIGGHKRKKPQVTSGHCFFSRGHKPENGGD